MPVRSATSEKGAGEGSVRDGDIGFLGFCAGGRIIMLLSACVCVCVCVCVSYSEGASL